MPSSETKFPNKINALKFNIYNFSSERDSQMKRAKKANQWHFGMTVHTVVNADSCLVYAVHCTAGRLGDVVEPNTLLHGHETQA